MADPNSVFIWQYECCGMPIALGHSTSCNCKYNVTFPRPDTTTSGTLSAVRKSSSFVFDKYMALKSINSKD